ncbi:SIS domain-containing protein [Litoribacter ruber]|uniref:SIS domain-containing protein n=1 Tax=Litoribacter ruber TaxID=702568 RepID=UPI001BDB2B87|nr:SIS domain-containing protein [Litoribacter ruber]MBT0812878.1 SIS domain-containing protein [Litoribacter ruber]
MKQAYSANIFTNSGSETYYTAEEISGQPILWQKTLDKIIEQQAELTDFLAPILQIENLRIILTGAGSSAFIGESLQCLLLPKLKKWVQAIPTTDIVSNFKNYLVEDIPTLMVSFARSGNSPESMAAVQLINQHCKEVYHIIITCNAEGDLANYGNASGNFYTVILPEESNDKSLAMTGSFTSMYLAGYFIFSLDEDKAFIKNQLDQAVESAIFILKHFPEKISELSDKDFERVVFLGSGTSLGIARECHLKLQELTDGKLICKHDSFLGFRHGPKVVINNKALVVFLFSKDEHIYKYEKDLAESILQDPRKILSLSIGKALEKSHRNHIDFPIPDGNGEDVFHPLVQTLIGQLLGYYFSLHFDLNPDNPSVNGVISRVVEGVTIYEKDE